MSQKEILEQLLQLNAIITGRQHLSRKQLLAAIERDGKKFARQAEVEQILADYVNTGGGMAIPGDVTDREIKAAFKRYKDNTIFRLLRTGREGGDMGDIGHGQSITEAARPQVLALAESGEPLKRDYDELSESAFMAQLFNQKKKAKTRTS